MRNIQTFKREETREKESWDVPLVYGHPPPPILYLTTPILNPVEFVAVFRNTQSQGVGLAFLLETSLEPEHLDEKHWATITSHIATQRHTSIIWGFGNACHSWKQLESFPGVLAVTIFLCRSCKIS